LEEGAAQPRTLSLFPEDRGAGALADASIVHVKLSQLQLRRPPNGAHVGSPWAMARTAARPVLVEAVGVAPQGDALGSGAVRTGYLSFARACGNGKLPRARILFPALGNLPDAIGNISS